MDPCALYDALSAVSLSGTAIWLLFTVAGLAFAWGGSGIAVSLAEYRARRPVPVVFVVPGEWLAYAATRDLTAVTS